MKTLFTTILTLLITTVAFAKTYTVERVIDGETLKLTNGEQVKLIGIDTPETKPNEKAIRDAERSGLDVQTVTKIGDEAARYVDRLLKEAGYEIVRLEYDIQERDKYGRLQAYVYTTKKMPSDGDKSTSKEVMLNADIIKSGYATPVTILPNVRHSELFKKLYREAREYDRGLWREKGSRVSNLNRAK